MENHMLSEQISLFKKQYELGRSPSIVGPTYHALNKHFANLYLTNNEELKGIYHLTEAHASTLRQQTAIRYDYKDDYIRNPVKLAKPRPVPMAQGIQKQFVDFASDIALQEEKGLLSRLREMPKEWTVVQLTRQYDPRDKLTVKLRDCVIQPTNLHITRLTCGSAVQESPPVSVLVGAPPCTEGMPTIYDLMRQATKEHLRTKNTRAKDIRKAREVAAQNIKEVVEDLSSKVLREWKCLLLGSLCSSQYTEQVHNCVDEVLTSKQHKRLNVDSRSRQLLCLVAGGAVHLSQPELRSAVTSLVADSDLALDLIKTITDLKQNLSLLLVARRHPVILILDDELDCMPWEMIPMFKKNPVSRVPSIHFLHALYHEHKEFIVDGCRLVNKLDAGFYIINPDQDLKDMEKRLITFLEKRMPDWKGVKGTSPTDDQFSKALIENNIFLYCGHYNGSHLFRPDEISALRVVALPLLFGCSSVALQDLGGHTQPSGISDKYFMAGCACVVGMLWTVTSDDTDCMTVMMLNSWLPGQPVDLTTFRRSGDMLSAPKEPELLRLLRSTRDTALLYSNAAALVARGIPVKMVEE